MGVLHPRVLDRDLSLAADVGAFDVLAFFPLTLFFLTVDLGVMGHVLELELHVEVEFPVLLAEEQAEMVLLEGERLRGLVGGKAEVVIAVQVHAAEQRLAHGFDGFLLRLRFLLELFVRGRQRLLLLEIVQPLEQLADHLLLPLQLGPQPGDVVLLGPCRLAEGHQRHQGQPETALHALTPLAWGDPAATRQAASTAGSMQGLGPPGETLSMRENESGGKPHANS